MSVTKLSQCTVETARAASLLPPFNLLSLIAISVLKFTRDNENSSHSLKYKSLLHEIWEVAELDYMVDFKTFDGS